MTKTLLILPALLLAACSQQPAGPLGLMPPGAKQLDSRALTAHTSAILVSLPVQNPPAAELAIVDQTPNGWRLSKAIVQDFAQAPRLEPEMQVAGKPVIGFEYHTGANSQGLIVVRDQRVVFDAVADTVRLQDVRGDGEAEAVKSWSPFCQSHAASPRLNTVYAWHEGTFAAATSQFAEVVAQDVAAFQAAVGRANSAQTTPAWTPQDKACLHDALAYLAELSGDQAEAAAQYREVQQLDPRYDLHAIAEAAAQR